MEINTVEPEKLPNKQKELTEWAKEYAKKALALDNWERQKARETFGTDKIDEIDMLYLWELQKLKNYEYSKIKPNVDQW